MSIDIAHDILLENSVKQAIKYLIACNILLPSVLDAVSFLRLYQNHIDASSLGENLNKESRGDGDQWNLICYHFVKVISFIGMNVVEA